MLSIHVKNSQNDKLRGILHIFHISINFVFRLNYLFEAL